MHYLEIGNMCFYCASLAFYSTRVSVSVNMTLWVAFEVRASLSPSHAGCWRPVSSYFILILCSVPGRGVRTIIHLQNPNS